MCNAYTVRPKVSASVLAEAISGEIRKLPSPLVRRSAAGVVVVAENDGLVPEIMRWGFHRPFSAAINNARADKLAAPTWRESLALRRCLVPVSTFFEWQPLPRGAKQAYEFRRPDGDWMWVAGLYERTDALGGCYATITTEPAPVVVPIHDRMLAVLDFEAALEFLRGGAPPDGPYAGEILAAPCDSPLKRKIDPQAELF